MLLTLTISSLSFSEDREDLSSLLSSFKLTGKRVNRGGGYGHEVPVIYYFTGPGKLVNWIKEKLNRCKQNLEKKNKKNHLLLVS